jgi:hypothetical protein
MIGSQTVPLKGQLFKSDKVAKSAAVRLVFDRPVVEVCNSARILAASIP